MTSPTLLDGQIRFSYPDHDPSVTGVVLQTDRAIPGDRELVRDPSTPIGGRLALPITTIFLVSVLGLWGVLAWEHKVQVIKYDLRSAMQYVNQQRSRDDLLILQIPHQEWAYRYYTSDFGPHPFQDSDARLGWWAGGPYTNWGRSEDVETQAVELYMRDITREADTLWVLLSEATLWDDRRMMEHWLQQHGALEDQKTFAGVTVQQYRMHP